MDNVLRASAKITKSYFYKIGRKAGAANYPRTDNPYSSALGESGDWDIGWSKKRKASREGVDIAP